MILSDNNDNIGDYNFLLLIKFLNRFHYLSIELVNWFNIIVTFYNI